MGQVELVFLMGFAGAGKSTVGRLLAVTLQAHFIDLDKEIEKRNGLTVSQIFERRGKLYFREEESRVLKSICRRTTRRSVVALGGGTILSAANRKLMWNGGVTIYLRCSMPEIYRRLQHYADRPLLHSSGQGPVGESTNLKARISKLMWVRRPYYEQADIVISTTKRSPKQVAIVLSKRFST